jgi:hypothetical protein
MFDVHTCCTPGGVSSQGNQSRSAVTLGVTLGVTVVQCVWSTVDGQVLKEAVMRVWMGLHWGDVVREGQMHWDSCRGGCGVEWDSWTAKLMADYVQTNDANAIHVAQQREEDVTDMVYWVSLHILDRRLRVRFLDWTFFCHVVISHMATSPHSVSSPSPSPCSTSAPSPSAPSTTLWHTIPACSKPTYQPILDSQST